MSYSLAEERCPVADQTLGDLYRSHRQGLATLVQTVSPDVRALLALYCYRRAHLQSLGLTIAASCSEDELVEAGGHAGEVLFALSRKAAAAVPEQAASGRRKITLSTGPLTTLAPLEDDLADGE
jgi:hypothetical protein